MFNRLEASPQDNLGLAPVVSLAAGCLGVVTGCGLGFARKTGYNSMSTRTANKAVLRAGRKSWHSPVQVLRMSNGRCSDDRSQGGGSELIGEYRNCLIAWSLKGRKWKNE
jgi:hypothetical protein